MTDDDLLREAREAAAESDGGGWGYRVTLDEGGAFRGRFRGQETTDGMNGPQPVYLLWDRDGALCFMYGSHKRLIREMGGANPEVGYDIAIVRGDDVMANGRIAFSYGVRVRPNFDALPVPPDVDDPTADW